MTTLELVFGIIVFLYSVIIHEVSHGFMALSMGDPTARDEGRLTFNPIPHIDMIGSVLLPLFLIFAHSPFVFGYAKPVPYNPYRLNDHKYGPLKVALAGPGSNLLLALMFGLVVRFLPGNLVGSTLENLLVTGVFINLGLALFNLIPVPPLDGHQLLFIVLPRRFDYIKYNLSRYGIFLFLLLIMFLHSFDFLTPLINFLYGVIVGR